MKKKLGRKNHKRTKIIITLPCTRRGRPNLVENELLTRVRHIVPEVSRTREEISRRWAIATDTGVVKANCPSIKVK